MHTPTLFDSFFMGGFECSTQRRADGRRLDLIDSTGHFRHVAADYQAMRRHGLRTVRDGVRWHLVETRPGIYDLSSFLPMLEAARSAGVQPIWDLCHYGYPDHVDIWRPAFVDAFAAFARRIAKTVRDTGDETPFYCLINEVSYWSWAAGDRSLMHPLGTGRGLELKHQLIRAAIAATEAVREVDPRARLVSIDPVIHVTPTSPEQQEEADAYMRAQYDGWLLLNGELWPQLGGDPSYLDIVGLNYYDDNQWWLGGGAIPLGSPHYVPLRMLLQRAYERLRRPLLLAETGAEGDGRAAWLRYVAEEVHAALQAGVPVEGTCLYPVLDYPGWEDDRHCPTGLLGMPDPHGQRPCHLPLAQELARQQPRFDGFGETRRIA
jgi:beta-glucosidase/6-phospho-beta-glucosidase/beta-galactosidase